jgi:hypothetical protein
MEMNTEKATDENALDDNELPPIEVSEQGTSWWRKVTELSEIHFFRNGDTLCGLREYYLPLHGDWKYEGFRNTDDKNCKECETLLAAEIRAAQLAKGPRLFRAPDDDDYSPCDECEHTFEAVQPDFEAPVHESDPELLPSEPQPEKASDCRGRFQMNPTRIDFSVFTGSNGRGVAVRAETVLLVTEAKPESGDGAVVTVALESVRMNVRVRETVDEVLGALASVGELNMLNLRGALPHINAVGKKIEIKTGPVTVPGRPLEDPKCLSGRAEGGA